ncbi:kynureninase [Acrocarpospora catenulata]|uniref:kynureninase n=1 Tax=Acrocarpospora catenulata TaxID=2836182 RepID=UPI001BDA3BCA|nr:kynureninase [Acrocarpospora catenulata]
MSITRAGCAALDAADPLRDYRDEFVLPDGVVYLLGNSLGALPKRAVERVAHTVGVEWGRHLGASWNTAGWWDLPQSTGDRIGQLIGAAPGEVLAGDSTSISIFKVLSAALRLRPDRRVIVCDAGEFPTDRYVVQGVAATFDREIRETGPERSLADVLGPDVAVVLISHVDYRTGAIRDMTAITEQVRAAGALVVWDLCHSTGALPVDVTGVDFAVGCTYKYLNGGPGAPAYLYVAAQHQEAARNAISGWHGHAAPFDFEPDYRPADGVRRFAVGSPPVISFAALNASLEIWAKVDMRSIRAKSVALTELFIALTEGLGLELATPRDPVERGSQVCFRHEHSYPIMRALIDRGVHGDFRAPDIMRFGFAPLYNRYVDVYDAADMLAEVLGKELWREDRYQRRLTVT